MILLARNRSRRWMIVTLVANFVRTSASSIAESPPPTTATSLPRKKKASQGAQEEIPWPIRRCSFGNPSQLVPAPVAMMTDSARSVFCAAVTSNGRVRKSTAVASSSMKSVSKRSACLRMISISSGPWMPSGKPGKFSTSVVSVNCPPRWLPEMTIG